MKQEAHGPHRSPEKTVQTNMIIIILIKRRKKPLFTLWEVNGSSFEQTWIPFTQGCFVPNLVEIGPAVMEKKFFNFVIVLSLFRNHLTFEIGWSPSFEQTWIHITQGGIVPSLVEIGLVALEKKIF